MLNFGHSNRHNIAKIDEFTVARISRLWESWLRQDRPERRNKHQFHRRVIARQPGLERVSLATVYVVLARHDARLGILGGATCSPA